MQARVFGGSFAGVDNAKINVGFDGVLKSIEMRRGNAIQLTLLPANLSNLTIMSERERKSFTQKFAAGIAGGFLLGGIGALAGVVAAGNKKSMLAILTAKDGRMCALELDDKSFAAILSSIRF